MSIIEVKVKLQSITIKGENSEEEFTVQTIRTAKEVAEYVQESEKDEIVHKLEDAVNTALDSDDLAF